MKVVGICRFSLLGRGDRKAFQGVADENLEALISRHAEVLFGPERMEDRLTTFENLTLSSIRNQSDPDFLFLVLASERMPDRYKDRLRSMCAAIPQIRLFFMPVMDVVSAQKEAFAQVNLKLPEVIQFRLDDDDCLCTSYIQALRSVADKISVRSSPKAVSIGHVLYSVIGGDTAGVYEWPVDFMSAGTALYHSRFSIYAFGHFNMQKRFESITVPGYFALVTQRGMNDTPMPLTHHLEKKGMKKLSDYEARITVAINFPFLTSGARRLAGLPRFAAAV